MRVLYSFPHKLGADRICYTAWQQVRGLVSAGADVLLFPGALSRPVPDSVEVHPTLARGKLRVPYKLLGRLRALALHDRIVARRLEKLAGQVDVVHVWPCGALETIKTAKRLGIPTVLERPNAHTRFAYEVVNQECRRLGVALPKGHEYEFNEQVLSLEEEEFRLADYLLCPSEFVAKTFRDRGFAGSKLLRHQYGFEADDFYPESRLREEGKQFTMLFAGQCAVRKGLHFAVDAWLDSPARGKGIFLIVGGFIPEYRRYLDPFMNLDPSIVVLGHRNDLPKLMRNADVFVLPSLEEGSPLVCAEAMASGCVNLVSEVCTDVCQHMENALVHSVGDVKALGQHINNLYEDKDLLARLREGALKKRGQFTWTVAGQSLWRAYTEAISHSAANLSVQGMVNADSRGKKVEMLGRV
ncbi:MAG: glycosyltransferase family 4 protein [Acidobacteriia bacterium]|nr:glycosyltransferase family 4 protein [Terriglobia bacterium]